MKEIWKDVVWYEWFYEISNLWRVKSLNYRQTWKENIMKSKISTKWYYTTMLSVWWVRREFLNSRLKAIAFIPNPDNKATVNHRDWNPLNNWLNVDGLDNLERATQSENVLHWFRSNWRKRAWEWKFWKVHPKSKKVRQYKKNWDFVQRRDNTMEVERGLWIPNQLISACCLLKRKTTHWFKRRYF